MVLLNIFRQKTSNEVPSKGGKLYNEQKLQNNLLILTQLNKSREGSINQ